MNTRACIKECTRISYNKLIRHDDNGRSKHFSFIIQKRKIIGYGINHAINPPNQIPRPLKWLGYHDFAKLHSEVDAHNKNKSLIIDRQFDVVNVRYNKRRELKMSAPCRQCGEFLYENGCRYIYFSTDAGVFAKIHCKDFINSEFREGLWHNKYMIVESDKC